VAESFAAGLVGVVLDDRYRLDAVLGEGGMGAVFRATHLAMDRRVAVKLLKPHLTSDETQLQRFAREARSTMKVDSPHAVKVLDFGVTPQRDYYMVLEYLDGRTVQRELDVDGPFAPARAVHIARQALHALGAAHRRGLVHRDIKPDNLLLMRAGADPDYTKVLDFGVAKLMEGAARSAQSALALTQMGMVFGTPEFMSPEQACGHPLDGRSDLYSLAATMFAMITGCGLFDGKSALEWLTHHARTPPPHLADARAELAAYPELDGVLQHCLAKPRDRRPRDADEMDRLLAAIEPTLRRAPGAAPPPAAVAMKGTLFSPSSFLAALPPESVAAGETLAPGSAATTAPERPGALEAAAILERGAGRMPAAATTVAPGTFPGPGAMTGAVPRPRRARGLLLAVGALVVVSMLGVALGLALTRPPARAGVAGAPAPTAPDAAAADAASVPAATDAGVVALAADAIPAPAAVDAAADPAVAARAPADAAPAPAPADARPIPPRPRADAGNRAPAPDPRLLQEHLEAAEAALRAGNTIGYLYRAEAAVQADRTSTRARLMYADALLMTGSKARGCEQLRSLRRLPAAQAKARDAGCPTD
jgi:eukaryotic-like serine/threonine-protein kinase